MRASEEGVVFTIRNRDIRICIAKALIELLRKESLENIKVTDLVKRANVSRMTFYKYYKTKAEVLEDYMYEIVHQYLEDAGKRSDIGGFHDYGHICHCFKFFQGYADTFRILMKANLYSIIINALNGYMDLYVLPEYKHTKYDLYYYAGALCNTYIQWIESNMQESVEEIATIVYRHL